MVKAFWLGAVLAVMTLSSCGNDGGAGGSTSSFEGPSEFTIEASVQGASTIDVVGSANLPDGAIISVSASRSMLEDGESEVRVVSIAREEVTLENGEFATSLSIDESDVLVGVGTFKLEKISSEVTVCAEFQTGRDAFDDTPRQSDPDVVDAVGEYGEALEGDPAAEEFGGSTDTPAYWLSAETTVSLESNVLDEIAREQGRPPVSEPLEGFCL